jgi:hypothetical protein
MKIKLITKIHLGAKRVYLQDPKLLKAYNRLTERAVLDERRKKALEELGVEFEE